MILHKITFREAWWVEDSEDDPVNATMYVEDNGENLIAHVETPDGMLSVECGELLHSLTLLTTTEAVQPP